MGPGTHETMKNGNDGDTNKGSVGNSTSVEESKNSEAVALVVDPTKEKDGAPAATASDAMEVDTPGVGEKTAGAKKSVGGTEDTPAASTATLVDESKKRVLVPVSPGSEDIEFMCVCDTLVRFGASVVVAGVGTSSTDEAGAPVCLSQGLKIIPDCTVDNAAKEDWDCIVLPGAMAGATAMKESQVLLDLLRRHRDGGRLLGAICASPAVVLVPQGLMQRTRDGISSGQATCYPANSLMSRIRNVLGPDALSEDTVAFWDNKSVITSQGPGTAFEFALRIGEELYGPQEASRVQSEMLVASRPQVDKNPPPAQPSGSQQPMSEDVSAKPAKPVRRKRAASLEPTKRRCPTSPSQAQLFSLIIWPVLEKLGWKFESERSRGTESSDERTLFYFPPGVRPQRPYSRMKRNVDCYHGRDAVVNLLNDLSFAAEPMETDEPFSDQGSFRGGQYIPSEGDKFEYSRCLGLYEDCLRVENDRAAMGKLPRGYSAQWLIQEAKRFPISEAPLFDHVIWPTLECLGWTCTSVPLKTKGRGSEVSRGQSSRSITSSIIDGEEHDPRPVSESKRRRRLYAAPAQAPAPSGEKEKLSQESDLSVASSLAARNLFDTRQQVLDFLEHDEDEWGSRVEVLRCRDVYTAAMVVARELKREGRLPTQSCELSQASAQWLVAETRQRRPILADIPKPVKGTSSDEGDETAETDQNAEEDKEVVDAKPKKKPKNENSGSKKHSKRGSKKIAESKVSKEDESQEEVPSPKLKKSHKEDSKKEGEAPSQQESPKSSPGASRERKSKSMSPGGLKEVAAAATPPRRASTGAKKTVARADTTLFNRLIWPVLESKGWTMEAGNRPSDCYYMPPGVSRKSGARNRKDFFDSLKQVQQVVEDRKEWNSLPEVQRCLKKYHACVFLKNNPRAMKELPKGHDFETFVAKAESLGDEN